MKEDLKKFKVGFELVGRAEMEVMALDENDAMQQAKRMAGNRCSVAYFDEVYLGMPLDVAVQP